MDAHQFDSMIRSLTAQPTRRGILLRVGGGLLAALPLAIRHDAVEAKKRKKRKNKKKKGRGPTPPPAATCADGVKNGGESDVDCGGPNCPPCGDGRSCGSNRDCANARCGDGRGDGGFCQTCVNDGICGNDQNGLCDCDLESGICFTDRLPDPDDFAETCPVCPAGTACRSFLTGFVCMRLCGG